MARGRYIQPRAYRVNPEDVMGSYTTGPGNRLCNLRLYPDRTADQNRSHHLVMTKEEARQVRDFIDRFLERADGE
jgi:hypothetical protein